MDVNNHEKKPLEMKLLPTGIKSIPKWIWLILVGSIMIISFGIDILSTEYPTFILIVLAIIVVVSVVALVIYVFYQNRKILIKKYNEQINEYNILLRNYNTINAELNIKNKDLLEAREKINTLEEGTKELQQELEIKSNGLESTQENLKETESELMSTKDELAEINKELNTLKNQFENNKKQLEETNKELEATKENLTQTENELAGTREKLILVEDELKRTNDYFNKIEKELHHRRESEVKPIFSSGANRFSHWLAWNKYEIWLKNVGNGVAKNVVGKCVYHTTTGNRITNINMEIVESGTRIVFSVGNNKDHGQCKHLSIEFSYVDIYGKHGSYGKIFRF